MIFNKITIVGGGYVGTSLAVLLSSTHNVLLVDNDEDKIKIFKNGQSPIGDNLIQDFLSSKNLNLTFSSNVSDDIDNTDLIILALPTNYDEVKDYFDTSVIESVIQKICNSNYKGPILIKSTVPIGFTNKMSNQFPSLNIIFSPEFLREGKALEDNLRPSRIIVGSDGELGKLIADMFKSVALNEPEIILMTNLEAEAVKLFSNTYLAMRVSYFNELDSFCMSNNVDSKNIISGVCSDPRIGSGYNNPSFGYGGYCLPKDTKQLRSNFIDIPQNLFDAIVDSNDTRKRYITDYIIDKYRPQKVGIYRLIMKEGSDNFRESAIFKIIELLADNDIEIIIYEPLLNNIKNYQLTESLEYLQINTDIILANRLSGIEAFDSKVFTRDIFGEN